MAENTQHEHEIPVTGGEDAGVEVKDRGLFDFLGKKEEEKPQTQEEVIATEFEEKVQVSESEPVVHKEEEKKESLLEKLHRSGSNSSSSSSDEEDEEKKKKKKEKKGLKEKMSGEKEEDKKPWELETNPAVSAQKKHEEHTLPGQADTVTPVTPPEEKKGCIEKIKDKLPGQHKKPEEVLSSLPPPQPPAGVDPEYVAPETTTTTHDGAEAKEKKGFLEKIKEKIPGYHPKTEEEKEKEKGRRSKSE